MGIIDSIFIDDIKECLYCKNKAEYYCEYNLNTYYFCNDICMKEYNKKNDKILSFYNGQKKNINK